LLKHGSGGKISLTTHLSQVLVVPQQSTFEVQDKTYVYIVDGNNTLRRRSIVPGLRMTDLYVVESGLSPSDQVLYEGIQQVKEGDQINPEMIAGKSKPSQLAKR
jgi:hypothetical protein